MKNDLKISFIGGGNMATALIGGIVGKCASATDIHVVDPNADALVKLAQRFGVRTAERVDAAVSQADLVVLAVKPQQMKDVAAALSPFVTSQLLVSIAAGSRAVDLSRWMNG